MPDASPYLAADTAAQLPAAVRSIQSYDAVVVLGAGASAASFPMTAQLPALLWGAFRADEAATELLAEQLGQRGSAKVLLGDDPARMKVGWTLVRKLPEVRASFQHAFAALDADRDPLPVHYALARLIYARKVSFVVSYNWDTCLERAYLELYGADLPVGILAKPHGDAANPDEPWVLPDEDGLVPDAVLGHLKALKDRPRTLLVVGYSASDVYVAETLLGPLESTLPVFRVSPSATGEGALRGSADVVVEALANGVLQTTQSSSWRPVRFDRTRGLEAALRGERLRPVDVQACPEFPASQRLAERILATSFATISGGSGSGKSITAFHAARRVSEAGWRVVEPQMIGEVSTRDVEELLRLSGPVLAVVDDAQALSRPVRILLETAVDASHAVLLVSTERLESRGDEVLSAARATQLLHDWCMENLELVAPLLIDLDDRVAWSAFRETPDRRLRSAAQSSSSPWVYMFAASGGERRLSGVLDRLVDVDDTGRTAVLFGLVCVRQFASEDAGASREQLGNELATAVGTEVDDAELERMMGVLVGERLVVENGGRFRAAHIRLANHATRDLAVRPDRGIGEAIRSAIGRTFLHPEVSLRGKLWLLQSYERYDTFKYRREVRDSVMPEQAIAFIVDQCLEAPPGRERGVALYMLWLIDFFLRGLERVQMERIAAQISTWLPTIDVAEAYGFRWMLGGLRSENEDLHRAVTASADPTVLASRLSNRGTRSTAEDWAHVLRELDPGPDANADTWRTWRKRFAAGIDADALRAWVSDPDDEVQPSYLYGLIDTLASLSTPAATTVLDACADLLREEFEADLASASTGIADWAFGVMALVAISADARGVDHGTEDSSEDGEDCPSRDSGGPDDDSSAAWSTIDEEQFEALSERTLNLFQNIDWSRAARSLAGRRRYELESSDLLLHWISLLSVDVLDDLTSAIPDDWFLEIAVESGADPDLARHGIATIAHWLSITAKGPRGFERVGALLAIQENDLTSFPHELIAQFPAIAASVAARGGNVSLQAPRARGWAGAAEELKALASIDPNAAAGSFRASSTVLGESLSEPQTNDLVGLDAFIETADAVDPNLLDTLIGGLDLNQVEGPWRQRLHDTFHDARVLLHRVRSAGGEIGLLAEHLLGATDT